MDDKHNSTVEMFVHDKTVQSNPPSHILQNGRQVYLPPPSFAEKNTFLERSIVRYDLLLQEDLNGTTPKDEKDNDKSTTTTTTTTTTPTIHPLAVASARLQANGIAELSKAINLAGLVSTGEYFGLANIVDPSLETKSNTDGTTTTTQETTSTTTSTQVVDEQRLKAEYIGKRKRLQFQQASTALERHAKRIAAAITAQSTVMDERLLQLRPTWRLVAPEHGTRALPHATRPTELVAIDVHVYDRDRTGGGNQAVLLGRSSSFINNNNTSMGPIARRVPRFATIALQDDYKVKDDLVAWKEMYAKSAAHEKEDDDDDDDMKVDTGVKKEPSNEEKVVKTRAEAFAVADPTLGKIDVDFDPEKVPMLTLQFDISKPSTGFLQSTRLSPLTGHSETESSDETVIVSLQHSLFCAELFESIRRELVPENNDEKTVGSITSKVNRTVWLSSEADENFLPPPSLMAGGKNSSDGSVPSLAVVHCHEGEVMVQLDCEYSLAVKLVEAGTPSSAAAAADDDDTAMDIDVESSGSKANSGSQSPQELEALCRALLLHAQTVFHEHSIKTRAKATKVKQEEAPGLARIQKKDKIPPARILESCVNLGSKMILERKVRRVLRRVSEWTKSTLQTDEPIKMEWLPLSTFDAHSQFALSFLDECIDIGIDRDTLNVTITDESGEYRQVSFHLDTELELFLKMEIRKRLVYADRQEAGALTPPIQNLAKDKGKPTD